VKYDISALITIEVYHYSLVSAVIYTPETVEAIICNVNVGSNGGVNLSRQSAVGGHQRRNANHLRNKSGGGMAALSYIFHAAIYYFL